MFSTCKNLKFWQFVYICIFDFVFFWLGIQYESKVWVIMGWREYLKNTGILVLVIPLLHPRWNGCILDSPWCLSVRLSICRQGFRNFLKKLLAQFISYLTFTLMGWVSWPLFIFVFLASFLALWWPNICQKMGFPELFEKTIGPRHFIPGIYPYGVSLLSPIHFRVPSLIFGPLVTKYLPENGVSGTFWKNYWLNSVFSWRIPICVAHNCKIEIFIGYFWMKWVVIRAGVYCPHLWAQLVLCLTL